MGEAPTNYLPQISQAYDSFQDAFKLAVLIVEADPANPCLSNITVQATELIKTIERAKQQ